MQFMEGPVDLVGRFTIGIAGIINCKAYRAYSYTY